MPEWVPIPDEAEYAYFQQFAGVPCEQGEDEPPRVSQTTIDALIDAGVICLPLEQSAVE